MMRFTDEEFALMLQELFDSEKPVFDTLCFIAEKQLKPFILSQCYKFFKILSINDAEDIMQTVQCKLFTSCIDKFFLRKDSDSINRDPEDFCKWIYTIASNTIRDQIKARTAFPITDEELQGLIEVEGGSSDSGNVLDMICKHEQLSESFAIVMDANTAVYKVLVWLALSIIMLKTGSPKKDATETLVNRFSSKTLFDMRNILIAAAETMRWLELSQQQFDELDRALAQPYNGGGVYGDAMLQDFYMRDGAKKSVSDWVYRMNILIQRVYQEQINQE